MHVKRPPKEGLLTWLKLGISTLNRRGWRGLKIKDLCQQLGVTKGSFYHWFDSKKDYEWQVLAYWKQRFTEGFISQAEQFGSSREKLSMLCRQRIDAAINGNRLEFELNAWSFHDAEVKAFVKSVYEQRYVYLVQLLADIYDDATEVKKRSLNLYALSIGLDLFYRPLTEAELELMLDEYLLP